MYYERFSKVPYPFNRGFQAETGKAVAPAMEDCSHDSANTAAQGSSKKNCRCAGDSSDKQEHSSDKQEHSCDKSEHSCKRQEHSCRKQACHHNGGGCSSLLLLLLLFNRS